MSDFFTANADGSIHGPILTHDEWNELLDSGSLDDIIAEASKKENNENADLTKNNLEQNTAGIEIR